MKIDLNFCPKICYLRQVLYIFFLIIFSRKENDGYLLIISQLKYHRLPKNQWLG